MSTTTRHTTRHDTRHDTHDTRNALDVFDGVDDALELGLAADGRAEVGHAQHAAGAGDALDLLVAQIPLIVAHATHPFSRQPHSGKVRLCVVGRVVSCVVSVCGIVPVCELRMGRVAILTRSMMAFCEA
jgi:hypothetical protein